MEYLIYVHLALVGILIFGVVILEYRKRFTPGARAIPERCKTRPPMAAKLPEISPQQACFGLGDPVVLDITLPFSEELVWDVDGTSKHGVPGTVKAITGYGMIDIEYEDGTILRAYALCCRPVHAKSE